MISVWAASGSAAGCVILEGMASEKSRAGFLTKFVAGFMANWQVIASVVLLGGGVVGLAATYDEYCQVTDLTYAPAEVHDLACFVEHLHFFLGVVVGRDVESMVRDLVENAIQIVTKLKQEEVKPQAFDKAVKKLAKILKPGIMKKVSNPQQDSLFNMFQQMGIQNPGLEPEMKEEVTEEIAQSRRDIEQQLRNGVLDSKEVTIELTEKPMRMAGAGNQMEQMMQIQSVLDQMTPKKKISRTVTVKEALELLTEEEANHLINQEDMHAEALKLAETSGIIFIDEIDKIAAKGQNGGEVSREGVQRDILPIVEGSQVNTKYGVINTDHILFIASGAFHVAKPSDLMPELQGRFPIRVELQDLSKEDFERILMEPKNALLKQYKALLATENVEVIFTKEAVSKLAEIAFEVNSTMENIGARRLHTILETVLEELLFEAPTMQMGSIQITEQYVESKLNAIREDQDLTKYIL
ncbi:ATP-dependent protease ATPase subunit HslU [uncultured Granulicatella sp.]|uniref:ATP-dependent protease ATPase subunit HslU n=1 Tax=uncultured Granulicatella sp. TaxID=316089 RepID=UPI0026353771|nr:ATP-dependent protease ATPase subunit HslU [uncultured Granulicatella sp.]